MGQQYLIDSNAAIDYLGNNLPLNGTAFMDTLIPVISIITRIEMLGWYEASPEQINKLLPFIDNAFIYPLSEPVILQTIIIRQKHKIKTPDSIIAATALVHTLTLISHNHKDFKKIPGLNLIDPHSL